MKRKLVFACVICGWIVGLAQSDSLERALSSQPAGQDRVNTLNEISNQFRDKNNRRALAYSQQALKLSDSLKYDVGKAKSLENIGWILYRMGDYTQSLSYSLDALSINQALADSVAIARCLNNIGAIGFEDENYASAIDNFKQALVITRKLNDRLTSGRSLNNLSLAYFRISKYDSSEYFAREALQLSQDYPYLQSYAYRMLGDLAVVRKQNNQGRDYFEKGLTLARAVENTFMETSVLVRLGNLLTTMKEFEKANLVLSKSIEMSKRLGYKNELEASLNGLSKLFEAKGDLANALKYKTQYAELHDSLRVETHRERVSFLQFQYDADIQKANLQLLTQQKLLNEQTIHNQWLLIIGSTSGMLVLLVGIALVIRANNKKTAVNRELAIKSEEIKKQADELSSLNHSKDKLFQLLSHDLRGPVRNVKNVFDMLTAGHITQDEFKELSIVLKPALDNLYLDLNNLLSWSKSQLSGIQTKAEIISLSPLVQELVERAREMAHQKKLTVTAAIPEGLHVYADPDHLTSILRNLLSNALKFSHDFGKIWVEATLQNGLARIAVKDEGMGLSTSEIEKIQNHLFFTKPGTHRETGSGIGLILVNEFLKANKGYVEITSEPGLGTTFTIILPAQA